MVHYSQSFKFQFSIAVITSLVAATATTAAAAKKAPPVHAPAIVEPAPKPGLPYCGTMNGIALGEEAACFMETAYPTPRFTGHFYVCPSQYHVAGRPGALRCDEET